MLSNRPLCLPANNRLVHGMSLVETAIAVAISAIVLTSAAPGWRMC